MFNRGERVKINFDQNNPKSATRTHKSFAKDADINNIMGKYAKTGILVDPLKVDMGRQPRFGDFSDIPDFGHTLNRIKQAQDDFMTLPAAVRAKFNNNVENLLHFLADPKNIKEAVSLKILPASVLPETYEPPVAPASQGASGTGAAGTQA